MSTEGARPPLIAWEAEFDHEVPAASEATTPEPAALGLALSGGGVRAALFSLGVVIALIDTGFHKQVRCVASVSGGSILNAALAHSKPRLGAVSTVEDFAPVASKLAASLAWRGAFAFDWRTLVSALKVCALVVGQALVPMAAALLFLADKLHKEWNIDLANLDYSTVPWRHVGWIALVSVLLSFLLSRGRLQEAKYASVLSAVAGSGSGRLYVRDWSPAQGGSIRTACPTPGGTPAGAEPVMHVLVATDLLSGEPMYFSGQFVHCKPYGWSTPEYIRTAEALYSSAAFPAVFPPKRLKLSRLRFQDGEMPGALPRTVRLADGGIYNNLGTDWFGVLDKQSQVSRPVLWPFGELDLARVEINTVIVVNASAPSRRVPRLWPFPLSISRIMSVLYDNTVRPRVESIRTEKNRPLIDIEDSPVQLARRLVAGTVAETPAGRRARDLVNKLEGRGDPFWADFSRDTAGTKTKLSPAGRRTGARLMLHGYLLTLVLLRVRFGAELPEPIRGEKYFLSLVPRPWGV